MEFGIINMENSSEIKKIKRLIKKLKSKKLDAFSSKEQAALKYWKYHRLSKESDDLVYAYQAECDRLQCLISDLSEVVTKAERK